MTITYTINHWSVEGNRRVNYGSFTMTSGEIVTTSLNTGLRVVETIEPWTLVSGGFAKAIYPTTLPEYNNLSGVVTIQFTSTAGPILWRAKGKV